jgi:hypothetical protein
MSEVKKRGRPKKQIIEENKNEKQVKKRGRKAAIKYFSSDIRKQIPLTTTITDNNDYILHIDVPDIESEDKKSIKLEPVNNPKDNIFSFVSNTKKEDENKSRSVNFFKMYESLVEGEQKFETEIYCWWCCHMFRTFPLGYPIQYYNKKFKIRGVFCSLECIKAYLCDNDKYIKYEDLFKYMCKKLCGTNDILKAPPRQALKIFGGDLDITEFRNNKKIFKMVEYPLTVVRDYIEEIDINNVKNINNGFVFSSNLQNPVKNLNIDNFLE